MSQVSAMQSIAALLVFYVAMPAQSGFNQAEAEYGKAEYFQRVGKKVQKIGGLIKLDANAKALIFLAKSGPVLTVPFDRISNTIYEANETPRYAAGLLLAWPLLFTNTTAHFMTIQYEDAAGERHYAVMHLDKSNAHEVVNAVKWVTKRDPVVRKSLLPPPGEPVAAAQPAFPLATFTSTPPGAEVRVDGEYMGTTPTAAVRQKDGVHRVTMRKAGYVEWTADLTAIPGETVPVSGELKPAVSDPNKPKIIGLE